MRVLVICGDEFHPAADVRAGLLALASSGSFSFDWHEDNTPCSVSLLFGYKVVVVAANLRLKFGDDYLSDETIWQDYMRRGGGLFVIHSGNAGRLKREPVAALTGATFINHPPECEVDLVPETNHLLTRGFSSMFTVHDEQYQMAVHERNCDVFMNSWSVYGVQPAGWTREVGGGRICALTPGHRCEVWHHPSFRILLVNALWWLANSNRASA